MNPHAATIARGMLTPDDVAAKCGFERKYVLYLARTKKLACYRFGHKTLRFKPSDVDAFVEKMKA